MHVLAPAKINLHLRVAPVNSDGFHPLQSWMCTVGLFDTLTFELPGTSDLRTPDKAASSVPLSLICDDPALPCDHSNLVMRAAAAMGVTSGSIRLKKEIPTGGGLGGGSSDAARTLMAISRLQVNRALVNRALVNRALVNRDERPSRSPEELATIAATLGSDVAFFCHGPSSLCTGRGEIVRPIAPPMPRWALLILPTLSVSTGPVYRRFDELLSADDRQQLSDAVKQEADYAAWSQLSAEALLSVLVNDLERPAFDLHPELGRLRIELEQFLARIVRMSGSGSSLFTLYDDRLQAERAAATLNGSKRNGISLRVLTVPLAPEIDDDLL